MNVFRLYEVFPPARSLSGLISANHAVGFAIGNTLLVSFGAWCYVAWVRRDRPAGVLWAWFWDVPRGRQWRDASAHRGFPRRVFSGRGNRAAASWLRLSTGLCPGWQKHHIGIEIARAPHVRSWERANAIASAEPIARPSFHALPNAWSSCRSSRVVAMASSVAAIQ